MKLFTSAQFPTHWIASTPEGRFFLFPARPDGWRDARPLRGVDPIHLRQIPIHRAFNTGMPGAPDFREILEKAA